MKYYHIFKYVLIFYFFFSFKSYLYCQYEELKLEQNKLPELGDSVIFINNTKMIVKTFTNCAQNNFDDDNFLNDHIRYYKLDSIDKNSLNMESYYRSFLLKSQFLEFEKNSFYKGNFVFSSKWMKIKNYGDCLIVKYYFPNSDNSTQRRTTIIVNLDKKEISIWDFDNIIVLKKVIKCDFNVRGNHTIYKMVYSIKCNRFIKL